MILIVFSVILLLSVLFSFYMMAIDKLTPVSQIIYPVIMAIIGFLSGYFAGSGRRGKSK